MDNVDNYCLRSSSPTFTMSPAPIVINKSPLIQFFNKKFMEEHQIGNYMYDLQIPNFHSNSPNHVFQTWRDKIFKRG